MKLSNTMMMNESLLPTGKKAFTLAEVLITLSILGVVAALTIPSLVNRQSDLAAQVKLKKAISNYEDVIGVYMVEHEANTAKKMLGTVSSGASAASDCSKAADYFKIVSYYSYSSNAWSTSSSVTCNFTTADGVFWEFDPATGNAAVTDSVKSPRYGVSLWNNNGLINSDNEKDGLSGAPTAASTAATGTTENGHEGQTGTTTTSTYSLPTTTPLHGNYKAYDFLNGAYKNPGTLSNTSTTTWPTT